MYHFSKLRNSETPEEVVYPVFLPGRITRGDMILHQRGIKHGDPWLLVPRAYRGFDYLYLHMSDSYLLQCRQNFIDNITPSNSSSREKEGYKRIVAIAKDYFNRGSYQEFAEYFVEGQYLISLWTAHMLVEYGSPDKDLRVKSIEVIKIHTENPLAPEVAKEERDWISNNKEYL